MIEVLGYGTYCGYEYRHITEITLSAVANCARRSSLCGKVKPRHAYGYGRTHTKVWWVTHETLEGAMAGLTTAQGYHKPCPHCVARAKAQQQTKGGNT